MQPATDLMVRFWQNIEKRKCVSLCETKLGISDKQRLNFDGLILNLGSWNRRLRSMVRLTWASADAHQKLGVCVVFPP